VISVFIGWGGRAGIPIATDLRDYLDGLREFRCFVARNITPGLNELEEIVASIKRGSDTAVMIVTNGTFRHRRWKHELSYLYRCHVPILPFVAEGAPIPSVLDYLDAQWLRFDPSNPSLKYTEIAQALHVLSESRRKV
jgi:hypothetical protein